MSPPHLDALYATAERHGLAPAFRTPRLDAAASEIEGWNTITYDQFKGDIETTAKYWSSRLGHAGISGGSVVGLW